MSGKGYYRQHRERILVANRRSARRFYERSGSVVRSRTKAAREELRRRVQALKESTPCADCGRHYPYYVTDYDHTHANKIVSVSLLVRLGATWDVIQAEIEKCELVCANCHRQRTHDRRLAGIVSHIVPRPPDNRVEMWPRESPPSPPLIEAEQVSLWSPDD